jgi:hypothetical protein
VEYDLIEGDASLAAKRVVLGAIERAEMIETPSE